MIIAMLLVGLASCRGDDDNEKNDEEISGSSFENYVKPELDDEAIQFVGIWQGAGPSGTGVKDGIWKFNNDYSRFCPLSYFHDCHSEFLSVALKTLTAG